MAIKLSSSPNKTPILIHEPPRKKSPYFTQTVIKNEGGTSARHVTLSEKNMASFVVVCRNDMVRKVDTRINLFATGNTPWCVPRCYAYHCAYSTEDNVFVRVGWNDEEMTG